MSSSDGSTTSIPIAIVGLSCRFPGDASSPSRLWDMLSKGRNGYSESTNRYNAKAFQHPIGGGNRQNVIPQLGGYFLKEDPYVFDAAFFNITASEAIALDPRQRIAMEVAYEALENAGLPLQKVSGTQTACYMGASMSDYRDAVGRDATHAPKYHILGTSDEMISNRISHFFNIHGPSATIETACSSSLVATHLACQSLRLGESEMALAGGVGLMVGIDSTMHLNNVGFLNPAGHSRSFDKEAGGYGRGEGCGVIVMKRLDAAIRDGDTVRAVIRGSGVNSDGWTQGVTMPSKEAQAALIKYVYESNGLEYGSTQYVEAHGTGTKVGDPLETSAIHSTIGQTTSSRKKLYIGSIKPNIGHLEAAAGAASIIKGILALEHGLIPPNIRFDTPNPSIPLDEWDMVVPTKLTPWPAVQSKRMSISGFGMGGTNAHIVLEAPKKAYATRGNSSSVSLRKRLFTFSSHDRAGFARVGKSLIEHLDDLGPIASGPEFLANLAHTQALARSGHGWRSSCLATSVSDLREHLPTIGEHAIRAAASPPRIGFVFTGQGAQWAGMGMQLLDRPVFGKSIARSATLLKEMGAEWDPVVEMGRSQKESRLGLPEISQPICSVLQIALVDELRSWGVIPKKVVGHSSGEIGAAYAIGALSHRDALAAAFLRGVVSASARQKHDNGGMMAVGCSRDDAMKLMDETTLQVTVACINAPSNITLSGDATKLEALRSIFNERGIFARRLKVEVGYHSPQMHHCSADYYASMDGIEPIEDEEGGLQEAAITMVSSVTGSTVQRDELVPYYWVQNLISPVLFADAVKELLSPTDAHGEKTIDLLVEVGPHSALGGPIEQILAFHGITNVAYQSVLIRGQNALDSALTLASELFAAGVSIDVSEVNGDSDCRLLTNLPAYPWNHSEKFRADSRMQREIVNQQFPTKSLIGAMMPKMDENERVWRSFIRLSDEPWLRGHTVGETVVFPAAGMISIVLEAAQQIAYHNKTASSFRLRDISFLAAMSLPEDAATEVTVHIRPQLLATSGTSPSAWLEFNVSSCIGAEGQLRNNCRGLLSIVYDEDRSTHMAQEDAELEAVRIADCRRVQDECPETCTDDFFYSRMAKSALPYGEVFRGVKHSRPGFGQTCFDVELLDIGETFTKAKLDRHFLIHAGTLDAIFQGWAGSTRDDSQLYGDFGFDKPMLPASIGNLEVSASIPGDVGYLMTGCARSHQRSFNEFSSNITMFDRNLSKVLVSIDDFRIAQLENEDVDDPDGNAKINSAGFSSETIWNYALDLLQSPEVAKLLSNADLSMAGNKFRYLVQLAIHQRPMLDVVELVERYDEVADAVLPTVSSVPLSPHQIHYGIIDGDGDEAPAGNNIGQSFALGNLDAPSPVATISADLFLVPLQVSSRVKEGLHLILDRLASMARPGAIFLIAAPLIGTERVDSPSLEAKGFKLVFNGPADGERIAIYRNAGSKSEVNDALTNGHHSKQVCILEPTFLSNEGRFVSGKLQDKLDEQGYSVVVRNGLSNVAAIEARTCISLLELETPLLEDLREDDFHSVRRLMLSSERLLWLTRGDNPSFGIIDGLARCVNNENAGTRTQILHLSNDGLQYAQSLVMRIIEAAIQTVDNEFREVGGLMQVQRVFRSIEQDVSIHNHLEDSVRPVGINDSSARFDLTIGKPGLLDSLRFIRHEDTDAPLASNELELEIKATGLNFRDVMASMGLVPVTQLGYEASGIVLRAGSCAAKVYQPGDRVSTVSTGGMHATAARCDFRVSAKMPDAMSFEEGAAVPTVHATAYYALVRLAKLRPGQSILIHAGAGGVGQAAIQLAKHIGLVIYTTVGSNDKRQFIKERYQIPDEHIFNSRDSSFAKAVNRVTKGQGVDCILNSLSGELLRVSWTCLAAFGTFVEIGVKDITENMRLDMRPFSKGATFTFFDLTTFITKQPEVLGSVLEETFKLMADGLLRVPLPLSVYPIGEAESAFRLMQQGKHRGKIVLSFAESAKTNAPVLCRAKDSLKLDPSATYLFIGGLGGLGRSIAQEFVASGARNLAFISRSGDSKPEARATVNLLEARGAKVTVFCADIAAEDSFATAMKQCEQQLPQVKGVMQMAMVLRDAVYETLSYEDWTTGLRPKVQGTWNLHRYFNKDNPLDFMIFASSISGVTGNPGQAQYDAGNTYQDALAHYRREQGLKAVSVNLGIMLDVGVIAESIEHNFKVWEETLGIREPAFHALMKAVINGQRESGSSQCPAQLTVGLGHADILASRQLPQPPWFKDPRFGSLTATSASSAAGSDQSAAASLTAQLTAAGKHNDQAAAASVVTTALVGKIADILRIPITEVDQTKPLFSYGVDSLVALEVRNWVTREIKASISVLDIMAAVPMETFAAQVAARSKLVAGQAA